MAGILFFLPSLPSPCHICDLEVTCCDEKDRHEKDRQTDRQTNRQMTIGKTRQGKTRQTGMVGRQ